MVCISRRPRCGTAESAVIPTPVTRVGAAVGLVGGIISVVLAVGKAIGAISVAGGVISVGGVAIAGAAGGGAIAAAATAIALIIVIGLYTQDRCIAGRGLLECIAGVVIAVQNSFASALDELLPFTAMHDRVDVVAKSRYWDVIEDGGAFVFCTEEFPPRRSEIMRCYFFDARVCEAGRGAVVGAIAGGVVAVIAGAAIAAAIGCATIIFCIFALLAAVLVAAVAVLVGALIGGQAAKAAAGDAAPTAATGEAIAIGNLVTIRGNMQRREHDQAANVLYFVSSASLHGNSSSPQPFSYCEIDDELATDGC